MYFFIFLWNRALLLCDVIDRHEYCWNTEILAVSIRLYKYGYSQGKLMKMGWNNKVEYASPVWDPHQITTTRDIEQVQRRAARFAYNCYQDNSPGCVTNMLYSLQWESLQQRRWKQSLVMCYKIHHQLIVIEPANYYTAGDSRTRGNHRLRQIRAKLNALSGKNPSGCWLVQPTNQMSDISAYAH
jgi:hypothetical protein